MAYNPNPPQIPSRRPYQQHPQTSNSQPSYGYDQHPDSLRPAYQEGDHSNAYAQYGHVPMPSQEQYMPQARPYQQQSYSYAGQPSQPSYAAYNPQQYAQQAPYASPPMSSPRIPASPNLGHQAYNPAAYATPPTDWTTWSSTNNSFAQSQQYQRPAPPVPPRPYEYESQVSQPYSASQSQYMPQRTQSSGISAPYSPPQPNHQYTPPAPPPPPVSANDPTSPASGGSYPAFPSIPPYSNNPAVPNSNPQPNSQPHPQPLLHHLPPLPTYPSLSTYTGSGDYETPSQEVDGFGFTTTDDVSPLQSTSHSPAPAPPPHTPQRTDTLNRHPQLRPLPGPPPSSYEEAENQGDDDEYSYEELMNEVEATVLGRSPVTPSNRSPRANDSAQNHGHGTNSPQPPYSSVTPGLSPDVRYSHTNGVNNASAEEHAPTDNHYAEASDDSDAEGAAGLAMMQLAEEQEAADRARRDTMRSEHIRQPSGLFPGITLDTSLGHDTPTGAYHYHDDMATMSSPIGEYGLPPGDSIHPFPSFNMARTDTAGSGGLVEPQSHHQRRLSFEDGDEATLADSNDVFDHSSNQSTAHSSMRSIGVPSRTGSRPLPRIPGSEPIRRQTDFPPTPDAYEHGFNAAALAVQKANSTGNHKHVPQVIPPGRSITDAEQRRRTQLGGIRTDLYDTLSPESMAIGSAKLGALDLPTIPSGKRRKFVAAKLTSNDFSLCFRPWAQSSILKWLKEMSEGESDLKEQAIVDGLVALFTHKVPTMNTADAEVLSSQLVEQMLQQGALVRDEEWVRFGTGEMSGVLFQLTGTGCYSSRLHNTNTPGRCYSYHCMRTLKKLDLKFDAEQTQRATKDWLEYYGTSKEEIESKGSTEVERQFILHEIITSEDLYMEDLSVLQTLYRDGLTNSKQPIISPQRLASFVKDVFGKVDALREVNQEYLLPQLKYRQREQGPWVKGFSDIFREWSRKARTAYIDYAVSLPKALLKFKKESEKNVLFKQFLDQVRQHPRSRRLELDNFLKAPIARLQRYGLLLATVLKKSAENEEKANLLIALEEVKNVTLECDARFAEQSKRADLEDLSYKLMLRPGMEKVQLNLNHLGREIVFRGDLQRSRKGYGWIDTHAILFDHYLVIGKPVRSRDAAGGLQKEHYDVSKLPIPMDLLVLESMNDDPVVKSSVKSVTNTLTKPGASATRPETLVHQNTGTSAASIHSTGKSLVTTTVIDSPNERTLYPFKVRHLGMPDVYVLYALTPQSRAEWCDKIIEAKTRHAASLHAQNAEPFMLQVLADTAFGFDSQSGGQRGVVIKGTPLDRAIEACDKSFYGTGARPGPVCRAQVNCAITFNQPYGKRMVAVGTDYGVYISEYGQARNWTRAIPGTNITQIAVLEDFSLFIIIADKQLIAYHLDTVCPIGGTSATSDSRRPPQKLSGNKDVGFFACGKQKDRTLVFYKKKDGISSRFKVLEPVYQKSAANSRSRFAIRKGPTDFFRDFDEFYIPSETYAINLFHSSVAVSSVRGVEVLTLDKKITLSIPDLRPPEVAPIAARISGQKPLGMYKLTDSEFLLVFENVGLYVDKHGDVSRAVVLEFVGRAKQACLFNSMYLILVDAGSGFVEVRNANNGRLRQIISGKEVRMLDDGATSGTVKISMQHPEQERSQVVLELQVKEGLKE